MSLDRDAARVAQWEDEQWGRAVFVSDSLDSQVRHAMMAPESMEAVAASVHQVESEWDRSGYDEEGEAF